MTINRDDIINIAQQLTEEKKWKARISKNKVASYAGNGILHMSALGPIGVIVGGAIGLIVGLFKGRAKYESVSIFIREMNDDQKDKLYYLLKKALGSFSIDDAAMLSDSLLTNDEIEKVMLTELRNFFKDEMDLVISPSN